MITLTIALLAASVQVQFCTPGAGSYQLFASDSDYRLATVVAAGWVDTASHVTAQLPVDQPHSVLWVWFNPGASQ